jgi:release factor glutamine methyltransferase
MVRCEITIGELENWSSTVLGDEQFSGYDTQALLCFCLGKNSAYLLSHRGDAVDQESELRFRDLIIRRLSGVPVAYLTGFREFWSLSIMVNESVLIPRPDTELLVEQVLEQVSMLSHPRVLELGTGSGAISLALATERPSSCIVATDQSVKALELARENQTNLKTSNICWIASDWFCAIGYQEFDVICSNPPYIASDDPHLVSGDLRSEPASALVAGEQGLDDLKLIIRQSPEYLVPGGSLLVEHGYQQGDRVRQIFQSVGYQNVCTLQDLADNDRVTVGVKPFA